MDAKSAVFLPYCKISGVWQTQKVVCIFQLTLRVFKPQIGLFSTDFQMFYMFQNLENRIFHLGLFALKSLYSSRNDSQKCNSKQVETFNFYRFFIVVVVDQLFLLLLLLLLLQLLLLLLLMLFILLLLLLLSLSLLQLFRLLLLSLLLLLATKLFSKIVLCSVHGTICQLTFKKT